MGYNSSLKILKETCPDANQDRLSTERTSKVFIKNVLTLNIQGREGHEVIFISVRQNYITKSRPRNLILTFS